MPRKNLLSLHEAIVVALISQSSRTAKFDEIAKFIEERNLYPERKGNIPLATQVMLRSTRAKGAYMHLFKDIGAGFISLRDSYSDYPLMLFESLDEILQKHQNMYRSNPEKIRVKDVKLNTFRNVKFLASNIICIATKERSGEKKYIYVKETDLHGAATVGIYTINKNVKGLLKIFDPLRHYFAQVSDSSIVNVTFYKLTCSKILKSILDFPEITELPKFRFSTSKVAKEHRQVFLRIQDAYKERISFEKSILESKKKFEKVI